jgi:hypothetical protein
VHDVVEPLRVEEASTWLIGGGKSLRMAEAAVFPEGWRKLGFRLARRVPGDEVW